jgi:hypothetical protein
MTDLMMMDATTYLVVVTLAASYLSFSAYGTDDVR